MVIARIRTNASRVTVRVKNGPARTITAPVARVARPTLARRVARAVRRRLP